MTTLWIPFHCECKWLVLDWKWCTKRWIHGLSQLSYILVLLSIEFTWPDSILICFNLGVDRSWRWLSMLREIRPNRIKCRWQLLFALWLSIRWLWHLIPERASVMIPILVASTGYIGCWCISHLINKEFRSISGPDFLKFLSHWSLARSCMKRSGPFIHPRIRRNHLISRSVLKGETLLCSALHRHFRNVFVLKYN